MQICVDSRTRSGGARYVVHGKFELVELQAYRTRAALIEHIDLAIVDQDLIDLIGYRRPRR